MENQIKVCQNCKKDFVIESEDFNFYEKIGVLPPKICSECRAQLRLSFRNERVFYKRPCGKCSKDMVSMYSLNKPYKVWCYDCYFADDWDASDYGILYDSNRPFLEQYENLLKIVPKVGLIYMRSPNSQYTNISADNKNCYMIVESSNNENCINCYWIQVSKDLVDCSFTNKVELSYEVDDCYDCHNLKYAKGCHSCLDSSFMLDCRNYNDCFGCVSLRGQKYNIFNIPHTKEEYEKFIKEIKLDTTSGVEKMQKQFEEFILKNPRKYAEIIQGVNSNGNYIKSARNCNNCFHCYDSEDCKYGVHTWRNAKDCMDVDTAGRNAELIYNTINAGIDTSRQIASSVCWSSTYANYSSYCFNCNHVLGCIGLRKKDYCILNKKYDKETYEKISKEIINKMKEEGIWGDFLPNYMSAFGYNETPANEQFPLKKEDAILRGYKWEDTERGTYKKETIIWDNFPESINDLPKDFNVTKEVFVCLNCEKNYRIIIDEFSFYKRMQIPIPRNCPECRHAKRLEKRGPNKLWHRKCMKEGCQNEFETSYAPDRPEVIYCERCYQQEVY
ncbi:MAG: hypothetical protein WCI41_02665 [bacterium]